MISSVDQFKCTSGDNRGIKNDFLFINNRKVPREVLKTEGEARGFQPFRGTLRMLMNDKIMFDRYYCINSTKHCKNEENIGTLYLAHLSRRLIGELIVYPWSVGVVRPSVVHNAQTSSSPKPLGGSKPNFMWSLLG